MCTTAREIEQFVGIYYHMGIEQMSNVLSYWETATRFPSVADVLSRDRFEKLKSRLHFSDNLSITDEVTKTSCGR